MSLKEHKIIQLYNLQKQSLEVLVKTAEVKCDFCAEKLPVIVMNRTSSIYETQAAFLHYLPISTTNYGDVYHEIVETVQDGSSVLHLVPCSAKNEILNIEYLRGSTHFDTRYIVPNVVNSDNSD